MQVYTVRIEDQDHNAVVYFAVQAENRFAALWKAFHSESAGQDNPFGALNKTDAWTIHLSPEEQKPPGW